MKAGDVLATEKILEEKLGISRTSIREALGLLETRHGVGRFLREFNYDAILANLSVNIEVNVKDFQDIIAVRMALASSFVEQVLSLIGPEDHAAPDAVLDIIEEQELFQTHTEFHG